MSTSLLNQAFDRPTEGAIAAAVPTLESGQVSYLHYLWLFNRQKVFLREEIIESSARLSDMELGARYEQMYPSLVDEVWPSKIGWISWSVTPWSENDQKTVPRMS